MPDRMVMGVGWQDRSYGSPLLCCASHEASRRYERDVSREHMQEERTLLNEGRRLIRRQLDCLTIKPV